MNYSTEIAFSSNGHSQNGHQNEAADFVAYAKNPSLPKPLLTTPELREAADSIEGNYKTDGLEGVRAAIPVICRVLELDFPAIVQAINAPRRIYTATEYTQRPPVTYLDKEKLIPRSSQVMLFGAPGKGKSLWLKRKLSEIADDMPIMLVLGEGEGGTPDRLIAEQKAQGKPLSDQFFIYEGAVNLLSPEAVQMFIDEIAPCRPSLIAFDTVFSCMPGGKENASEDWSMVISNCQLIRRQLGATTLLVHHATKDGSSYRGHSSIHGACDAIYEVTQEDEYTTLTCFKSKDSRASEPQHYRLVEFPTRLNEEGEQITGAALLPADRVISDPNKLSGNQEKVLEALDGFTQGVRYAALLAATGLNKSSLHQALKRLIKAGYVTQSEAGEPYYLASKGESYLRHLEGS